MTDIAIVDYGMGNLRSVAKALEHVAPEAVIAVTNNPEVVRKAGRVVVPGQGAMPDCLHELDRRGLREAVQDAAANKPFLGICIGLQMLFDNSEEGNVSGLGIVPGRVKRFPASAMKDEKGQKLKVPHMGWNQVHQAVEHPLWKNIVNDSRFISCTATMSKLLTPIRRATVLIPFLLLVLWRKITFLPFSSTPKRAMWLD